VSSKAQIAESYGQNESNQEKENFSGAPMSWRLFLGEQIVEV
jgi:hypothetical protein